MRHARACVFKSSYQITWDWYWLFEELSYRLGDCSRMSCCRIQCVFWHGEVCQHLDMHYLDQNPLLIAFGITMIIGYSSIIDDHNIFFHPFGGKILKTCTWQQHRRTSNSNRPEFEFDQFIGQQTQVAILQPFQCFVFKFGMRIKRIETDFCFACICVCCLKCMHGPVMCVYVLLLLLCFAVSLWFRKANTTRLARTWSNSPLRLVALIRRPVAKEFCRAIGCQSCKKWM